MVTCAAVTRPKLRSKNLYMYSRIRLAGYYGSKLKSRIIFISIVLIFLFYSWPQTLENAYYGPLDGIVTPFARAEVLSLGTNRDKIFTFIKLLAVVPSLKRGKQLEVSAK